MRFEPLPVDNAPSCGQLDLTADQGAALAALEDDEPLDEEDEVLDDDEDEDDDEELELDDDESEDFVLDEDESELVELAAALVLPPLDSARLSVR
jgi:hypothetical protein